MNLKWYWPVVISSWFREVAQICFSDSCPCGDVVFCMTVRLKPELPAKGHFSPRKSKQGKGQLTACRFDMKKKLQRSPCYCNAESYCSQIAEGLQSGKQALPRKRPGLTWNISLSNSTHGPHETSHGQKGWGMDHQPTRKASFQHHSKANLHTSSLRLEKLRVGTVRMEPEKQCRASRHGTA